MYTPRPVAIVSMSLISPKNLNSITSYRHYGIPFGDSEPPNAPSYRLPPKPCTFRCSRNRNRAAIRCNGFVRWHLSRTDSVWPTSLLLFPKYLTVVQLICTSDVLHQEAYNSPPLREHVSANEADRINCATGIGTNVADQIGPSPRLTFFDTQDQLQIHTG